MSCRNIPACAGKTTSVWDCRQSMPEHPRVRGENLSLSHADNVTEGTSPRARGKPGPKATATPLLRNIPACAGKTGLPGNRTLRGSEHPRVRGENLPNISQAFLNTGTSPRARGKR